MSAKDDILGTGSKSNSNVPPPIDSSLQGAPGASSTDSAGQGTATAQTATAQTQTNNAPSGTDKSQQLNPVAQATLPPSGGSAPAMPTTATTPIAPPPAADTGGNASKGFVPGQKMKPIGQILAEAMPIQSSSTPNGGDGGAQPTSGTAASPSNDDDEFEKKMQAYYDEYKAKRDKGLGTLMDTMNKMAEAYKPPTEEELEKERKKRKREQIFNAIGDGIQALSNLYFTTQYAPNSYNPKNSLSAKAQERYDKIDKEREADKDKYYNIAYNQYQMQNAADMDDMGWMQELEQLKAKRAAAKAKAEADNAAAAAKQANADRDYDLKQAKQDADAKRADARDAETRRHNRAQEAIGRQNAATSSARASGSGGGGGGKTKYTLNIGGKVYTYNSQADYERAVQRYAKGKNLRTMQSVADGTDVYGNPKRKTSAKPISQLAAEVEDAYSTSADGKTQKKGGYKAVGGQTTRTKKPGI